MAALAGCSGQSSDGACTSSTQCDLAIGGLCTTAPSQKQFCAYPDSTCPGIGGYRWSTYAGDGLASQCFTVPVVTVSQLPDRAVMMPDTRQCDASALSAALPMPGVS